MIPTTGYDVAWKMGEQWVLLTLRSPRETRLEPMAVYFPREGSTRYQYRVRRKPQSAQAASVKYLES